MASSKSSRRGSKVSQGSRRGSKASKSSDNSTSSHSKKPKTSRKSHTPNNKDETRKLSVIEECSIPSTIATEENFFDWAKHANQETNKKEDIETIHPKTTTPLWLCQAGKMAEADTPITPNKTPLQSLYTTTSQDTHPVNNNKEKHPQDQLSEAIREGENKFHNLTIGESNPEDYLNPNWWKSINSITTQTKITRRPPLSPKILYKGDLSAFKNYKNALTGHFRQVGAGYLFKPSFIKLYFEHGDDVMDHWKDKSTPRELFVSDKESLFGAIQASNQTTEAEKEIHIKTVKMESKFR